MWHFKLDHIRHVVENEDAIFLVTQRVYASLLEFHVPNLARKFYLAQSRFIWLATGLKEKEEARVNLLRLDLPWLR